MADLGDPWIDFGAGQFAAFAGLGTLRDLDLDFVGIDQILAGDAEAAGGDLFDGGALAIAVRHGLESFRVLAAFAGVRLAAKAVHGDGERFVGLLGDRAIGHGTGLEAFGDGFDGLDFLDRHRRALVLELHQAAQGREVLALVVDLACVLFVNVVATGAHRLLEKVDGFRIEEVEFAVLAPLIGAAGFKRALLGLDVAVREGGAVADESLLGDLVDAGALATAGSAAEVFVHHVELETDGFENLRAAIGGDGGDAHLGHGLDHTLDGAFEVVVNRLVEIHVEHVFLDHVVDAIEGHVGVDGIRAVADEGGEVVDFPRFAGFQDDGNHGAGAGAHQVVVKSAHHQQGGHRGMAGVDVAVGNDEDIATGFDGVIRGLAKFVERGIESLAALVHREKRVEGGGFEAITRNFAQLGELLVIEQRMVQPDHAAALRAGCEQVALGADEGLGGGDEFLADAIEGRVGDLREDLLEILIEVLGFLGKHGKRRVVAHRADRLDAGGCRGPEQHAQILVSIAKGNLTLDHPVRLNGFRMLRCGQILEENAVF